MHEVSLLVSTVKMEGARLRFEGNASKWDGKVCDVPLETVVKSGTTSTAGEELVIVNWMQKGTKTEWKAVIPKQRDTNQHPSIPTPPPTSEGRYIPVHALTWLSRPGIQCCF